MNNRIKIVDPLRVVEDMDRRNKQKYTGLVIQTWQNGEIKNIREEYEIEIEGDPKEQWNDSFKHFAGMLKWNMCGRMYISLFKGHTTKIKIDRSIPMEKFWKYKD